MDFCIGPLHTDLLLGQVRTKGMASEASENMMERSRVRAWHCLQHRLGSGGRWEGVLQQPQWPFVVQGCPETLFHNGSLELYHNGYREPQEAPLPLPGILGEAQL